MRQQVFSVLKPVMNRGRRFDQVPAWQNLDDSFARMLVMTTLRMGLGLDRVYAPFLKEDPSRVADDVRVLLRMALAQVFFMDVPDYAALDTTLQLADQEGLGRQKKFINGVLRAVLRARDAGELQMPEVGLDMLPPWLQQRLIKDYGEAVAAQIACACLREAPLDITDKQTGENRRVAERGGRIDQMEGYAQGAWWVQDVAAAQPVQALSALGIEVSGQSVLDVCAAPGGKTMQLAALGAEVTALDISEKRLGRVYENLQRTRLSVKEIIIGDALHYLPETLFDGVVLDAPCTATGTIRRHPDLIYSIKDKGLKELSRMQGKLLERAFTQWLRPGGWLVYCTCSLLHEEGEQQIAPYQEKVRKQQRLLPHESRQIGGQDGFFFAVLQK